MTNPSSLLRAGRVALVAATLALLAAPLPTRAASAVDLEVRPLVGGRYEVGGWLAISVTLVNDGSPTDGYLSTPTAGGTARRYVDLPAGARKVVTLYVEPEAFQRNVTVTYTEPNGTVEAAAEVRVLEQSNDQVAVIGDATGTLRPQLLGVETTRPEPISLTSVDIPERPEPLDGLSAIVWAGDSTALSEPQRASLERWVSDGGQLIVLGGPDWQARATAFAELLPVESLVSADGISQASLAAWSGGNAADLGPVTVSTGSLRSDARALVVGDDGTLIAATRPLGAGRVVLIGVDLATEAHRGWAGSSLLWARLLPTNAALEQWFGGGFPVKEEIDSAMSNALGTLPTLDVPPAEFLLLVIVGYIILIGPVSYFVLRRVDRRELAWVTAPILVILFSACSYGIGRTLKGTDVVVNQISILRTAPGGAATAETYTGVFSPDRSTYDLTVDADALIGRLGQGGEFGGVPVVGEPVIFEQGQPAHLRELSIGTFGFAGVKASGLVEYESALSVTWDVVEGETVGTITNGSDVTITDVAYISSGVGRRIGEVAPGAAVEFTVPGTNFNASSASDQVYGFGGFDTESEEQRRISMRRQVIDALVGYNAFMGGDMSAASGRGPYLIGWREDDEGPMPITVDGLVARRFTSSVEVLSVRPSIGTGELTIEPAQMGSGVIATEGDVVATDPAYIAINDGSVTFAISLPLDASGLEASSVEIIAGPDISVIMGDPGGFGGFWPDTFTIELRNPTTGAWTLLGNLSERNRFTIENPADAISVTGRIEVRVTGSVDPNFGQTGIFVTARVSGVLD